MVIIMSQISPQRLKYYIVIVCIVCHESRNEILISQIYALGMCSLHQRQNRFQISKMLKTELEPVPANVEKPRECASCADVRRDEQSTHDCSQL